MKPGTIVLDPITFAPKKVLADGTLISLMPEKKPEPSRLHQMKTTPSNKFNIFCWFSGKHIWNECGPLTCIRCGQQDNIKSTPKTISQYIYSLFNKPKLDYSKFESTKGQ